MLQFSFFADTVRFAELSQVQNLETETATGLSTFLQRVHHKTLAAEKPHIYVQS